MKSDLAEKLKELLGNMTQEEFNASWEKVTRLGLKGPTIEEYSQKLEEKENIIKLLKSKGNEDR